MVVQGGAEEMNFFLHKDIFVDFQDKTFLITQKRYFNAF
jgi:hypothetical protein